MRYIITALLASTTAAFADVPTVVTDIPPVHALVAQVMGDLGTPTLLLAKGADEHDFALRPSQAGQVTDAGLVVWIGHELTPWLEGALENRPSGSAALGLLDAPGTLTQPFPEEAEHETEGDGHQHGTTDPHAWLNPDNAKLWLPMIATELSTLDPANAAIYAANAAAYKTRIKDTIAPLRAAILALPENRRWLATCEGAFSYLARDFQMKELYLWPINADATGTPQQVRRVIDAMRANAIPAIFCESTVNQAPAEQVAREVGAAYGGVLYVDSLTEADGPVPTYLDLLRVTAQTIVTGLSE